MPSAGREAVAAFPLISAGAPLGSLVAYFARRSLSARHRSFMATVAAMCAQAITRAHLFDAEKRSVEALQRHLLPQRLPDITDVEIAVRYDPSGSTVDIGGDWFDVIALPGGAAGLVIGDVEGHDVEAAALMGLVRSAVRAYALEGHPPAFILDRANLFLAGLHAQRLVTVSYVQLHPGEHLAIAASAGHLPTFVAARDGDVAELPSQVGPPLGVVEETLSWPETTSTIPTEAILVAFTDGLVEGRDADISVGLARVQSTLAAGRGDTPKDLATALVQGRPRDNDDDIALLVAKVSAAEVDPTRRQVTRRLPATAASVFISRRFATQVSRLWSVPEETCDSLQLAISELATNAARHSDDVFEVRLVHTERSVRVAVGDSSHRMPHRYDADDDMTSGRGLSIIETISDRWGIDSTGLGKTVWCEFDLPVTPT
jgi:serine phosphatase RsbU (regulator of sigma subunit)/anti-sigma regulatory factor (Ser/Thr protein kinase)